MTSKWWWVAALGAVACESADETATAADASVTGDTPALSGDVPGAEDVIETADVPAADDIAAAEDTPGAVDVSIAEDVPGAEDVPMAADIPELADIPGAVDVPEAADIPGAVDVPESPDIPGAVDVGGPQGAGETCLDAIDLEAASSPSGGIDYPYEVSGALGQVNDYNPLIDSGLPPACSLVYDAYGRDKVYVVTLQPGEILEMLATL